MIRNLNLVQGTWQQLSFVVYNRQLSIFINGEIQRTVVLDGVINDVSTDARIGQRSDGKVFLLNSCIYDTVKLWPLPVFYYGINQTSL